ncbi:LPS translocon maturation chaperone LptM [Zoogloea sp.]|uniref:LPS translocon maturation chaperone LptM n=1 Tax=Zoogloea sp. TaxID=49181 RepID=UPI0026376A79|nr:lipoprotein [uncultured Zoogloea sp.]
MRTIATAAAACGLIVLGGCGIKGPLQFPQVPKPIARPAAKPAASAPAPAQAPAADHNKPAPQDSAQ